MDCLICFPCRKVLHGKNMDKTKFIGRAFLNYCLRKSPYLKESLHLCITSMLNHRIIITQKL